MSQDFDVGKNFDLENIEKDILEDDFSYDTVESVKIVKVDFHKYELLKPLLEIHDIPKQLFIKAKNRETLENFLNKNFENKEYKILTIVGSRKNSNYGKDVLDFLLRDLIGQNIIIVSGLALGIDSLSHKAALKNNFPTISVPGSGLSKKFLYPSQNIDLAENILKSGNILISEYEDDTKSSLYMFPARNRIMAAIADTVLIVEAGEKSGTLITARLAMEYGKNVGVVPNNIFAEVAKGSNKLIQDGASPILNSSDLLELLNISKGGQGLLDLNFKSEKDKEKLKEILETLNKNERIILEKILHNGSLEKDTLLAELENEEKINYTDSLVSLMSLEINGFIKEEMGEVRLIR